MLNTEHPGLFALNMINGGRWLTGPSEFDSSGKNMNDFAAFQNSQLPERRLLEARRGVAMASQLDETRQVKRACIRYVRRDTGAATAACIMRKDGHFWAFDGADANLILLTNVTDMAQAIETFHGQHAKPGTPIEYLFRKPAGN